MVCDKSINSNVLYFNATSGVDRVVTIPNDINIDDAWIPFPQLEAVGVLKRTSRKIESGIEKDQTDELRGIAFWEEEKVVFYGAHELSSKPEDTITEEIHYPIDPKILIEFIVLCLGK